MNFPGYPCRRPRADDPVMTTRNDPVQTPCDDPVPMNPVPMTLCG